MMSLSLSNKSAMLFASLLFFLLYSSSAWTQSQREYIYLDDRVVTVENSCAFFLSQANANIPVEGITNSEVTVSSATGCTWSATKDNQVWFSIAILPGKFTYSVTANTGTVPRTGIITIAGQTFTITQAGCSYSFSASNTDYGVNGGTGTIEINCGSVCPWAATDNTDWITLNTNVNGPGHKILSYT
jgi:hypothetical protein